MPTLDQITGHTPPSRYAARYLDPSRRRYAPPPGRRRGRPRSTFLAFDLTADGKLTQRP